MPALSAVSTGALKAVLSMSGTPMPLAFEAIAVSMAETIWETTEFVEPVQLVGATREVAEVLDAVDRRGEERVRGHVVVHHEVVLRVRGEERVVVVALVGLRTGSLLAQDLGNAAEQRQRGRGARVAQEAPSGQLSLCTDLVVIFFCHAVPISLP